MPEEPEQAWQTIADVQLANPGVTAGTGFGRSQGIRIAGKIFAMLVDGELVVKLPKDRVEELSATGAGRRFDPGHGRLMKEWAVVGPAATPRWAALVEEARAFVQPR